MKIIAIIPARFDSTRFPGKPLAILGNKPIIHHVYERAFGSGLFAEVIVATDDQRIFEAVDDFGGKVALTSKKHQSGSDRVAEICAKTDCDVVVNIQGDEPFISKKPLIKLISVFENPNIEVASLMHKLKLEIEDPNQVKVVCDNNNFALYFSRSEIPHARDGGTAADIYKHLGFYAYKKSFLDTISALPNSILESVEKLEQLRVLEYGYGIKVVITGHDSPSVDRPEDIPPIEKRIRGK